MVLSAAEIKNARIAGSLDYYTHNLQKFKDWHCAGNLLY